VSDAGDLRPEALIWCEAVCGSDRYAEREKRHEPARAKTGIIVSKILMSRLFSKRRWNFSLAMDRRLEYSLHSVRPVSENRQGIASKERVIE